MPSDPDKRIGGTLDLTRGRGGRLELDGGLVGSGDDGTPKVIYGDAGGKKFTLCEARYSGHTASRNSDGVENVKRESWGSVSVLRGVHTVRGDEQRYTAFDLQTANLALWLGRPTPRTSFDDPSRITLTLEVPEPIEVVIPDLGTVTIWWREEASFGVRDSWARLSPTLALVPKEPLTTEQAWTSFVVPFLFFMTFVLGSPDRIANFWASFTREDAVEDEDSFEVAEVFVTQWGGDAPEPTARWRGEYLLQFEDVEPRVSQVLPSWFDLFAKSRESFLDFYASAVTPFLYMEEEFSRVVRALESWHRLIIGGFYMEPARFDSLVEHASAQLGETEVQFLKMRLAHANERTLKQRLDELVEQAGEPVAGLVAASPKFNRKVVNTRNSLTHEGKIGSDLDELQVFWATKMLTHVFQSVLLGRLGFDSEEVAKFVRRSADWKWLASASNPLPDWSRVNGPLT